jgi:hypothetical protein
MNPVRFVLLKYNKYVCSKCNAQVKLKVLKPAVEEFDPIEIVQIQEFFELKAGQIFQEMDTLTKDTIN